MQPLTDSPVLALTQVCMRMVKCAHVLNIMQTVVCRIMSVLADGVLVAGVVVVAFPLLKKKASGD